MRGNAFLHNFVLLDSLERPFRAAGATVHREFPVSPGRTWGYVDLFIIYGPYRIVGEAERTSKRVGKDIAKATALRADYLLIISPTLRIAKACERRLETFPISESPTICFLIPGTVGQWVTNSFPLMTESFRDQIRKSR